MILQHSYIPAAGKLRLLVIAIICSDYEKSKAFYTKIFGFTNYQGSIPGRRQSYKLDLALGDHYLIELFSFPSPPPRTSAPEATGLRHLAFRVKNIEQAFGYLTMNGNRSPSRGRAYKQAIYFFQRS